MDRHDLLKAEYVEAGQCCRAQESYVRTTLNIYVVLATSVAGLLAAVPMQAHFRVGFCFVAFAIGFCMALLVARHRKLYASYSTRARSIESELGLRLYTEAKESVPIQGEATAKELSVFIVGGVAALYFLAALVFAFWG